MSISSFRPLPPGSYGVSRAAAPQQHFPGPATGIGTGSDTALHELVQADMPGGAPVTPAELRAAGRCIIEGRPGSSVVLPPVDRLPRTAEFTATVLTLAFLPEIIHAETAGR